MLFCSSFIQSVRFLRDVLFISRFRRDEHTVTCWSHVDVVAVTVHVFQFLQLLFLCRVAVNFLVETRDLSQFVPRRILQLGERRYSASVASWSVAWLWVWSGVSDFAVEQRLQADQAARLQESANFQLGGPEKLICAHDPQHVLQKSGGLADQQYMDDGDIMYHPILVFLFLQDFDVAHAGAARNLLKTKLICCVNDLVAASWPKPLPLHHARSRCWVSAVHHGPAPEQGRRHPSNVRTRSALPGPADRVRPRESLGVSRVNHILRVRGHAVLEEQSAAEVYEEIWQRSLERLLPGLTEDTTTQATLSAGQSGTGFNRAPDIDAPAHLGSRRSQAAHPGYDPRRSLGRASP